MESGREIDGERGTWVTRKETQRGMREKELEHGQTAANRTKPGPSFQF
jgi:hypothetical protein